MTDQMDEKKAREIIAIHDSQHPLSAIRGDCFSRLCSEAKGFLSGLEAGREGMRAEIEKYQRWVNDLQSGMFINCVYCGHQYGPKDKVPSTMADALKSHVEKCPKHPMSALRAQMDAHNNCVPHPDHARCLEVYAERSSTIAFLKETLGEALTLFKASRTPRELWEGWIDKFSAEVEKALDSINRGKAS